MSQPDPAITPAISVHELLESARSLERAALRAAFSSHLLGDWSDGYVRGLRDGAAILRCNASAVANPSDVLTMKAWRYVHRRDRAA